MILILTGYGAVEPADKLVAFAEFEGTPEVSVPT